MFTFSLEGTGISPKPEHHPLTDGWSTTSPTTPADRPFHEHITPSSQPHMLNNLRTPVFGICSPANVSLFSSQQCSRYGTLLLRQQGHPVVGVEDDDDRSPMATVVAVTHNGERQKISRLPRLMGIHFLLSIYSQRATTTHRVCVSEKRSLTDSYYWFPALKKRTEAGTEQELVSTTNVDSLLSNKKDIKSFRQSKITKFSRHFVTLRK